MNIRPYCALSVCFRQNKTYPIWSHRAVRSFRRLYLTTYQLKIKFKENTIKRTYFEIRIAEAFHRYARLYSDCLAGKSRN